MKFVLMPDKLSAVWFRSVLASKGSVGVKVGTFTSLLDTLKSLWLLPDIDDVFDHVFKTAVLKENNAFWSKSINVDELAAITEIKASLKHILSALPLNTSLEKISEPNSRITTYFNDLVSLHQAMGEERPLEQKLAMQWLSQSNEDPVDQLQLIYLPELFDLDIWQLEVVQKLISQTHVNSFQEHERELLVKTLQTNTNKAPDLQQLVKTLYSRQAISSPFSVENIRWLACRDSLHECEVLVGMIQKALSLGVTNNEMAIVLPLNSEHLNILPKLLNKSGILTSNLHQTKTTLEWDVRLLKDLLIYFKKQMEADIAPMSLAAIFTNPLMPWSLIKGQRYADAHFRGILKERVRALNKDEPNASLLKLLFRPDIDNWKSWIVAIIEQLNFPSDTRFCSKSKLLDLVESLVDSILLCQGQTELAKINSLINQLQPKHISIEDEYSGHVLNGVLLLTESDWLFQPIKHLFITGFNQGSYIAHEPSIGVFSGLDCNKLTEHTSYSLDTAIKTQLYFQTKFTRLLSQPDSSITILLSQQSYDGEKLHPSESLLDMALCFQATREVAPEQLIQSISAMYNPAPFFKECESVIPVHNEFLTPTVLCLGEDLFGVNQDKDGNPRTESPSSLEKMMTSPFAWFLGRQGLEPYGWEAQNLGVALKGTIAHKVFELHFDSKIKCTFGQCIDDYERLYQAALQDEAPFLLQPQWRLENTQLKHEIKKALGSFIDWCETNGWTIHTTEQMLNGELWSLPLKGFADVVLKKEQKTLILDYKKSKANDRITRLNSGYDIQTLIYRELFSQQVGLGKIDINSGYYTLNDQTLILNGITSSEVKGISQIQIEVDLASQSEAAVNKIKERIKQLRDGKILLNYESDEKFWKKFGINTKYSIDENPLVKHFMKPAEEQEND